ncbi:hypothetical protein AM500_02465 [Bacillus sp. FJAT-18017]|nr:hypothetical protein AM500_02465 [Bacillus sp. FJAT-18017]
MSLWGKKGTGSHEPGTREKIISPIIRLWRKLKAIDWKNPVNRWKLGFIALLTVTIGASAFVGILSFTNSPSYG